MIKKIKVLLMKRQKGGNHVRSEINKSNRIYRSSGDTGFSGLCQENKNNTELIENLIERARDCKGLSRQRSSGLLECDIPVLIDKMYHVAKEIKTEILLETDRNVCAFLYLSNYCINGCVYCPYHAKNKHIRRKKLTQEEIRQEVIALQDMGHKRLALETGEDPKK